MFFVRDTENTSNAWGYSILADFLNKEVSVFESLRCRNKHGFILILIISSRKPHLPSDAINNSGYISVGQIFCKCMFQTGWSYPFCIWQEIHNQIN